MAGSCSGPKPGALDSHWPPTRARALWPERTLRGSAFATASRPCSTAAWTASLSSTASITALDFASLTRLAETTNQARIDNPTESSPASRPKVSDNRARTPRRLDEVRVGFPVVAP